MHKQTYAIISTVLPYRSVPEAHHGVLRWGYWRNLGEWPICAADRHYIKESCQLNFDIGPEWGDTAATWYLSMVPEERAAKVIEGLTGSLLIQVETELLQFPWFCAMGTARRSAMTIIAYDSGINAITKNAGVMELINAKRYDSLADKIKMDTLTEGSYHAPSREYPHGNIQWLVCEMLKRNDFPIWAKV